MTPGIVKENAFDFHRRVLTANTYLSKKRLNLKLKWHKRLGIKNFPEEELVKPLSEKELIEMAADGVVNFINLVVLVAALYIIWEVLGEAEKASKDQLAKQETRAVLLSIQGICSSIKIVFYVL